MAFFFAPATFREQQLFLVSLVLQLLPSRSFELLAPLFVASLVFERKTQEAQHKRGAFQTQCGRHRRFKLSLSLSLFIYIYTYIYVCMCGDSRSTPPIYSYNGPEAADTSLEQMPPFLFLSSWLANPMHLNPSSNHLTFSISKNSNAKQIPC